MYYQPGAKALLKNDRAFESVLMVPDGHIGVGLVPQHFPVLAGIRCHNRQSALLSLVTIIVAGI